MNRRRLDSALLKFMFLRKHPLCSADVGPLIALAKLELLDLPCRTFVRFLVRRTVLDECLEQVYSRDAMLIGEAVNNVFPTPVGIHALPL